MNTVSAITFAATYTNLIGLVGILIYKITLNFFA